MGFWQGVNEGLTYVLDQKAAEASEEKAYAFRREEYQRTLVDNRRDRLLELKIARGGSDAEASALTGQAQAFYSRLGKEDLNDPRAQALLNNPALAAQLEEQVYALEKERAKTDGYASPLQGQNLLDIFTVYDGDTGTVAPAAMTVDDLMELNVADSAVYEQAVQDLTRTQGGAYATINPSAYSVADPKKLEEGRKMFDQLVLRQAQTALLDLKNQEGGGDPTQIADLQAKVDGYKEENSVERMELQNTYGYDVYKTLLNTDNPYIQNFKSDPQFSQFSTMYSVESQLRDILADPEASQADRDGAAARLQQWGLN